MISSKKILSIMATMMTYCSMAPIQTCAMEEEDINNCDEQHKMKENNSDAKVELSNYQGKSFSSSVPEILQDIAERMNVYRVKKNGYYFFTYEFNRVGTNLAPLPCT